MFYLWFLFLHIFLGRILKLSLGHSFDRKFLNCRAKDRGTNGCRDHPKTIINGSFTWLLALIILKSRIPCDTLHPIIHYCVTFFKSGLFRSKSRKTLIRIKKEPQFITIHHLARPKSNEIIFYGTSDIIWSLEIYFRFLWHIKYELWKSHISILQIANAFLPCRHELRNGY